MSKGFVKKVESIAKSAIEDNKETKYVTDLLNSYTTIQESSSDVDAVNKRMLTKISLVIPEGDDYKSRDGDKVELRELYLRFRIQPADSHNMIPIGATNPGSDLFPKTTLCCHLLRIDKAVTIAAGDIDQCLKRPQELWFDDKQAAGKARRKLFTVVDSFKIPLNYRDIVGINSGTIPPEATLLRCPQMTFMTKRIKLNKVTQFNSTSSNEPVKYDYYLFATWGRWNRGSYENQTFPNKLDYWKSFTFKDM